MTHHHFTIIAYERELYDPKILGAKYFDGTVEVLVDADSEPKALEKAKKTINRKFYRTQKVFRCETDHDIDLDFKLLQLKLLKKQMQ